MALGDQKFVYIDPYISLGGTELSPAVSRATLSITHPVGGTRRAGRHGPDRDVSDTYDWQIDIQFEMDSLYAEDEVNQTIWGLMKPPLGGSDGKPALILRGDSDSKGAANPEFRGNVIIDSWAPFGDSGQVGEFAAISRSFMGASDLSTVIHIGVLDSTAMTTTSTDVSLDSDATETIAVGDFLLIGDEQMKVTTVTAQDDFDVSRGAAGTTAATHTGGSDVFLVRS